MASRAGMVPIPTAASSCGRRPPHQARARPRPRKGPWVPDHRAVRADQRGLTGRGDVVRESSRSTCSSPSGAPAGPTRAARPINSGYFALRQPAKVPWLRARRPGLPGFGHLILPVREARSKPRRTTCSQSKEGVKYVARHLPTTSPGDSGADALRHRAARPPAGDRADRAQVGVSWISTTVGYPLPWSCWSSIWATVVSTTTRAARPTSGFSQGARGIYRTSGNFTGIIYPRPSPGVLWTAAHAWWAYGRKPISGKRYLSRRSNVRPAAPVTARTV